MARFIRFHPLEWNKKIAMRIGLLGCAYKGEYPSIQPSNHTFLLFSAFRSREFSFTSSLDPTYQCVLRVSCVMRLPSILESKYSNIFFYKTTRSTVLKFHMKHDLTSGSQNCKTGSDRTSWMTAVTKTSKK